MAAPVAEPLDVDEAADDDEDDATDEDEDELEELEELERFSRSSDLLAASCLAFSTASFAAFS